MFVCMPVWRPITCIHAGIRVYMYAYVFMYLFMCIIYRWPIHKAFIYCYSAIIPATCIYLLYFSSQASQCHLPSKSLKLWPPTCWSVRHRSKYPYLTPRLGMVGETISSSFPFCSIQYAGHSPSYFTIHWHLCNKHDPISILQLPFRCRCAKDIYQ